MASAGTHEAGLNAEVPSLRGVRVIVVFETLELGGAEPFGPRDYDPAGIDPRMLQLSFAISRRLGFQSMAYDLMVHRGQPVVLEMSDTFGVGAHKCGIYWTPELERVERDVWPYTAQVEDFVRMIEARRPGTRP